MHLVGEVARNALRNDRLDVGQTGEVVERSSHASRGEILLQTDEAADRCE